MDQKIINEHNTVNIVMITDEGYVMPTAVSLLSIKDHISVNRKYVVYILCNFISEESKLLLKGLSSNCFEIQCIDANPNDYLSADEKHVSATKAALLKFFIPSILKDLNKVLYLDGDTIIQTDIAELYDVDLGVHYLAAVRDLFTPSDLEWKKRADFYNTNYFNSGVLLINAKVWREMNISSKLVAYRLNGYNYFMDQDALNAVISWENVLYLHPKFNFQLSALCGEKGFKKIDDFMNHYGICEYYSFDELICDAKIIHYTFGKPWKYYDSPLNSEWYYYYKLLNVDFHLVRKSLIWEIRESFYNTMSQFLKKKLLLDK